MGLKLIGEIALDGSGWEAGLNKLSHSSEGVAHSLKHLAMQAFGVYGIEQAFEKTIDRAKELVTEAKRTGMAVEGLQVLKQAAKDSNTELGTLIGSFEKLNLAREKALNGGEEGKKLLGRFQQLGISTGDLQSKTAAQLFMGPIRATAGKMNQGELGPILRDVFGKGFGELIPVLKTDFEELEDKMKRLGTMMDTDMAVKLAYVGNELELVSQIIIGQAAPAILGFVDALLWAAGKLRSSSSFWGAATAKWSARDFLFALSPMFDTKPLDVKAGLSAMAETDEESKRTRSALDAKLKELADNLKNRIAHAFGMNTAPEKTSSRQDFSGFVNQGDQLTRVGNFLGSSRSLMESIGQQQLDVLRQIARNTTPAGYGMPPGERFPPT